MGREPSAVGSVAVCKFCGKEIRDNQLIFAPKAWVHTETAERTCWPSNPVATPKDD